jgi:prepilin-type N-terminal cleavage/methylation domain-containing protein
MRRGFTLVELLSGISVMALVVLGSMTLLVNGLRSFNRTSVDVRITQQNAQAQRRISETIRQAMSVSISNGGATVNYTLPATSLIVDPVTGEKEHVQPLVSDGVARSFVVDWAAGTLKEMPSGRVLVRNITNKDPEAGSAQYNQAYVPFQLTTIGSYRAVTINLITRDTVSTQARWMRMKTTALVRNSQ